MGARTVGIYNRAFLYDTSTSAFTGLGTLGGNTSIAYGINDTGTIVGSSSSSSGWSRAFQYSGGVMTSLGTLLGGSTGQSHTRAINNIGQIVGWSNFGFGFAAFLYDAGVMTNLNSMIDPFLGITVRDAYGISNNGAIIARSTDERAYLLTPLDWTPEGAGGGEVPEPSAAALALSGGLAAAAVSANRRHRRQKHRPASAAR